MNIFFKTFTIVALSLCSIFLVSLENAKAAGSTIRINQTKSDILADRMQEAYSFSGKENEPLVFRISRTGNLRYNFRIIDGATLKILEQQWVEHDDTLQIIFTPQKTAQYYILLTGYSQYGRYTLSLKKLPGTRSSTKKMHLSANSKKTKRIADHMTHRYEFSGKRKTPLLFQLDKTGAVKYHFQIIDQSTNRILRREWVEWNNSEEVVFSPPRDGKYTVVITGFDGYGYYHMTMRKLTKYIS